MRYSFTVDILIYHFWKFTFVAISWQFKTSFEISFSDKAYIFIKIDIKKLHKTVKRVHSSAKKCFVSTLLANGVKLAHCWFVDTCVRENRDSVYDQKVEPWPPLLCAVVC